MKRIIVMLISILLIVLVPVSAASGAINDNNVDYIYWDQSSTNMVWTGVTNKIDYNWYKPCVGVKDSGGYFCGAIARKNIYKEHGATIYVSHMHFLESSYGTMDYIVE